MFINFVTLRKIIIFQKISSILFQYSERTIASRETNNCSKERSYTQHFGDGKFEGLEISRGRHALLQQKA